MQGILDQPRDYEIFKEGYASKMWYLRHFVRAVAVSYLDVNGKTKELRK
jgi:hypothetical protein